MENAAKSLLMAGGILIGILVLSLAVYLFLTFGEDARAANRRIEDVQLTKFNAQFNVYADRDDITIYDIISLANLAEENNNYYKEDKDYESNYKIVIKLDSTELQRSEESYRLYRQYLLKNNNDVDQNGDIKTKYSSKTIHKGYIKYNDIGRVSELKFVKL